MSFSFFRSITLLSGLICAGFISVLFLPANPPMQDSRLSRELSNIYPGWRGENVEVGSREREVLAKDTDFLRKEYTDRWDKTKAPVSLSVVFSGRDVNNSIHRPETCLRTQGWNFLHEETIYLKDVLPNGEVLPLRKLVIQQPLMRQIKIASSDSVTMGEKDPSKVKYKSEFVKNDKGENIQIQRVQYYTFLGTDSITASHWERVGIDVFDRVRYGYDQAWAYTTISTEVLGVRYSSMGHSSVGRNLEQTEEVLKDFIAQILPRLINEPKHTKN